MDLEPKIIQTGQELFALAKGEQPSLFNRNYWQGRMLDWVMKDPGFKVDMLRFVDVLPQLTSNQSISDHVGQYLLKEGRKLPVPMALALKAATSKLSSGLAARAIKKNVEDMAGRFILGQVPKEAISALRKLHLEKIAYTVDLLGEATVSEKEAQIYIERYIELIGELSEATQSWPASEVVDKNHLGTIPRTNVSLKLSALSSMLRPTDPKGSVTHLKEKLLPLLRLAKQKNVFINFDLEQWDYHEITYDLFEEIALLPEFKNWINLGIVVQAYLKESQKDIERLISIAKQRQCPLTVRLVKGAYWDFEIVQANQRGLMPPVIIGKSACDANYEKLSAMLLDNIEHIHSAFGSHNLRSLSHAIAYAQTKRLPRNAYEIQMLFGMAEPERRALVSTGHRIRLYSPLGDLLIGMAYLVRRLLENTSNSGFLQLTHHAKVDVEELMKKPAEREEGLHTILGNSPKFVNCPFLDFLDEKVRNKFQQNLDQIKESLPLRVPSTIDGKEKFETQATFSHRCPSDTSITVSEVFAASKNDCELAVSAACRAFSGWRSTSVEHRSDLLLKLADLLEKDRYWLAALQTLEVGKPWIEADADVGEAIDFCRFYAGRAHQELGSSPQGKVLGEENEVHYLGRGPTVVIAPWNFPLAILCGMSAAALVSGNPVLMKPAEQSSATAFALFQRMIQVGFPKDVVHFLPGVGEEIGPYLVEHPKVTQIIFTGSKEVGLSIYENAAKTKAGQPEVKRVVAEMGGKNAIIIDDDADLDEAVLGVVHSAFGFAGQKCSACSRVIVLERVADSFIERLIEATKSLPIQKSFLPSCVLGPVIDQNAQQRLFREIEAAKKSAKLLYIGEKVDGGYFVPPSIFEVETKDHHLMQNEFFGPLIAVMRVKDFQSAIEVANSTQFALTGAVFSRSPRNLKTAKQSFQVGNLYLNRGSTGAMVGRQPFGGYKMSGLGAKAGGANYLLHFAQAACVTENTMRRGFTPEVEI